MTDIFSLKGRIVATIENSAGDILQKAESNNFISDAFSRLALWKMFGSENESSEGYEDPLPYRNLRRIVRMSKLLDHPLRNVAYIQEPSNHGIYCMSSLMDVDPNTFWAPYCLPMNTITLSPNVTFFNINGDTKETEKTMIPNDSRCYFDPTTNEFVTEYLKNTGTGIINSIAIGKSHEQVGDKSSWGFGTIEPNLPIGWATTNGNFMVEPTTAGDFIWTYDTNIAYRLNPISKEVMATPPQTSNITFNCGAIVVGANVFRTLTTNYQDNTNFIVRLDYRLDFRNLLNSSLVWPSININFPVSNGGITGGINNVSPSNVNRQPVLIYRPDTGNLELFATTSMGAHTQGGSPVYGCHLQKAIIDPLNPTGTAVISSLGLIPYAIGRRNDSEVTYELGQYDLETGRYRLPFRYYWDDASNTLITSASASDSNWTPAIETSDFTTFSTTYPSTWHAKCLWPFYSGGKRRYLSLGTTDREWIWMSQLVSGANLSTPLEKQKNSIFRLQYRYRLT